MNATSNCELIYAIDLQWTLPDFAMWCEYNYAMVYNGWIQCFSII